MFTGIIQEIAKVKSVVRSGGNLHLTISAEKTAPRLLLGSSVSVNGVCQTVISTAHDLFTVEAIDETLTRSNLGELREGAFVNLESPLTPSSLLDGHLVQGHVDCKGKILKIGRLEGSHVFTIEFPGDFDRYVVEKGSIAVDGISLTIASSSRGRLDLAVIPHTMKNTILGYKITGDTVNLEFDMIAKYVEKMVSPRNSKLTADFLKEHGYF